MSVGGTAIAAESAKSTVLVVDDTPENIHVLDGILRDDYRIKVATNGERALKIIGSDDPPDLILLDVMMPGMSGYEVCETAKRDNLMRRIPIIFVTAKSEVADEQMGFELGAVDYITKPVSPPLVRARVRTQLALYDANRTLEAKVRERTAQLESTRQQIIRRLGRAAEYKDNETGLHVIRMSYYSQIIALAYGMDEVQAELLLNAAPMHDIGKIGIPDSVLLKPGKLDDAEWETMRRHPGIGAGIIGKHDSGLLDLARVVALTHHEKWNGKGYPTGKAGEEIPLSGRIVAIADVFDALTTERPYKKAWSDADATQLIRDESGKHFDPALVEHFVDCMPKILEIKQQYAEGSTPRAGMSGDN